MITIFDSKPAIFEYDGRTLTVSNKGVLCTNKAGQVTTDIDFANVNELFLTRYLNSNNHYSIIFRDNNWKNIPGNDLDTDLQEQSNGHNIRETKAIIAAFARHKLTPDFPSNIDTLDLAIDYSQLGKREVRIRNGVLSNGKTEIPIRNIRRVVCVSNGTISNLFVYTEEKPSSFFKKLFATPDMKITLNALTVPLLEAIVTRNTGHGIDFSRGDGFEQKTSEFVIIRYLDAGYFLDKDGNAATEWQKTAAARTASYGYNVKDLL
ncbi:Uncharacterised protein [Haemophilus pittmaniae]|uniref:Uncharacterized protein n=1 Tax=Haemophilus pittmaniae TaxID=249188 RepID=A0A377J0Y1_9PAST|nr:hypothetical protein [Haemophilus pittmaniae]MBS6026385.1 hypothetical protein [Haemophilus pittmaniae]STO94176.1 Uncharacterised protein [Haemophilus pittmaniae]